MFIREQPSYQSLPYTWQPFTTYACWGLHAWSEPMADLSESLRHNGEHQREIGNSFQLPSNASPIYLIEAHFTWGVKTNVQLKSCIPIGAKVEISPKGFTLGLKAENRIFFSICPQVTNKCWTLCPCIGAKAEKKYIMEFGKRICNPWSQCSSIY